jgi:hypothetical protein
MGAAAGMEHTWNNYCVQGKRRKNEKVQLPEPERVRIGASNNCDCYVLDVSSTWLPASSVLGFLSR